MQKKDEQSHKKIIATNHRAHFDYFLSDYTECGLVLTGTEIKSLRAGHCSLTGAYVDIRNGECFVVGMNISPYKEGNIFNVDPMRDRKLLLHKDQILKLAKNKDQNGYTIVPVECYLSRGRAKLEIALGKGKKAYDKRQSIKEKDIKRRIEKASKNFSYDNR